VGEGEIRVNYKNGSSGNSVDLVKTCKNRRLPNVEPQNLEVVTVADVIRQRVFPFNIRSSEFGNLRLNSLHGMTVGASLHPNRYRYRDRDRFLHRPGHRSRLLLIDPGDARDRQTIHVQVLVAKRYFASIPIAIPISISICCPNYAIAGRPKKMTLSNGSD
jgi:hypothetical protein